MTKGGVSTNSPTVSRSIHAVPPLISQGCALPASPEGKLLYRAFGCLVFIGSSSILKRAERHIGRSLRFRWWVSVFNRRILRTGGITIPIVGTMGAKVKRPSPQNCQLSIVHCQFEHNCQLSTVNCQLISPNASISFLFSSGSFTATRYQPSPRPG